LVAWVALRLVLSEFAYGGNAFAGLPAWLCQAVIPFAFGGIALRQLVQLGVELHGLGVPRPDAP
jgi:TRAP-type C4-dicarboxylate transport system permease small subunit